MTRKLGASMNYELVVNQASIEKLYQESMDIRDSTPTPEGADEVEEAYTAAYQLMYKIGEVEGFRGATQEYRRRLRVVSATAPQSGPQ